MCEVKNQSPKMEVSSPSELLEIKSKENEKPIWSIKNFDQTLESQHDKKKGQNSL